MFIEYKMKDVNSSFLTDVYPIEGAFHLVDSLEGLHFSIKHTHRKFFYFNMVTPYSSLFSHRYSCIIFMLVRRGTDS